ncbi:MAG TPA: radical SAM protein [Syntrophales bacterium]|nr:radical SAM protein [Syntrophales bacterium]
MLLIHPPVIRPCEAPAGIAGLAGFLRSRHYPCQVVDLNLEGLRYLLETTHHSEVTDDTWTRRALKNRTAHLAQLSLWKTYRQFDRHGSAVRSLKHVLATRASQPGVRLSLTDYEDANLLPIRSDDLIQAAKNPEGNPFYPFFAPRLSLLIETKNPPTIGISLNYLPQALCTFAIIGWLRKHHPKKKIVLGGGLITSWLSRPDWHSPFEGWVDDLVSGPGEPFLADLLSLDIRQGGNLPDYSGFPRQDYLAPGFILPYSASRGCWWRRCAFCPEKAEDSTYCPTPPEQVRANLKTLIAATHPILIHFLDNALSPPLLQALIKDPPGVPWYGFARFTTELRDPDFCRALKASGCVMLKLGLESGDQNVLDSLKKGIELEGASQSLKQLHEAGVGTYVYLLFGTPAETAEAAGRTMAFVSGHKDWIDFLNVAIFNLPAFSQEAEELETLPFYEGDLSLYLNFRHPHGWNRDQVRRFLDREFKRHPAIAPILRRDPACFTSNHAPLFLMARKT